MSLSRRARIIVMSKVVPFAVFAALVALSSGGPARAQTACPVGTAGQWHLWPRSWGRDSTAATHPCGRVDGAFRAVAADMSMSGNTGVAANRLSREDAEREAMGQCRSLGSAKCGIVLHYSNPCVAIVSPPINGVKRGGFPVTRPGKTVAKAITLAIPDCRKANETVDVSANWHSLVSAK
jgi:hypothetical protein